ncbi:MAG: hypothetical protein AAF982_00145 [Pseudomonadota bacterium]
MTAGLFHGAAAAALCLALAGCGDESRSDAENAWARRSAPQRIAVGDGNVVIAGPRGYCVDLGGTRHGPETAFVLMGNCAALIRDKTAPQPWVQALLAASIAKYSPRAQTTGDAERLDRFFRSPQGRAALSRVGRAEDIEILDSFVRDDTYFLRVRDAGGSAKAGLGAEHWRAVMVVNEHLVSLSVTPLASSGDNPQAGLTVVSQFAASVRGASAIAPGGSAMRGAGASPPSESAASRARPARNDGEGLPEST